MPVVLVEVGGVARSGHEYGDRTGIEYEYPSGRYENWVRTGERFVYQVPGAGYTGSGVIGAIRPSVRAGRLLCDVLGVSMFDEPVPLKDANGEYFEADKTFWKKNVYWGQGVRPLSNSGIEHIVRTAEDFSERLDQTSAGQPYADSVSARAVEEYSITIARRLCKSLFEEEVVTMPRNNPGFDLRVGSASSPAQFVEVKGTRAADPVFFLSEGERLFSIAHSALYTLIVVSGIDLNAGSHAAVHRRNGAIDGGAIDLSPTQWRGRLVELAAGTEPS